MITSQMLGEKISSNSTEAFALFEKSRFGEKKHSKIEYSLVETLHLSILGKMQVFSNSRVLTQDQLLRKSKKLDRNIQTKLSVFSDLRKKGYIVKTALKFGAEFRVYDKGIKPGQSHARWICYPIRESQSQTWYDFAAKNRVAHATKKKLLIAITDDEDDVTYYEVGWIKP